ncbi:MAG: ATP-grasp domain-containing protein [Candidatus Woesearchaeota archaeon]
MNRMRIAVLSNFFSEHKNKEVEIDLMMTASAVKNALEDFGHAAEIIDIDESAFERLRNLNIDLAFNVCERYKGASIYEPHVAAMLELFGIPYTGSGPFALSLCMNKIKVKEILMQNGIPTPKYQVFYSPNQTIRKDLKFPLIVKPSCNDNSIGIDNDSVVEDEASLKRRVRLVLARFKQPVLVEEFLHGREFAVGIMGNSRPVALPISEFIYSVPDNLYPILSYDAKWLPNTEIYKGSVEVCPAQIPRYLEQRMKKIAIDAFRILEVRDYGRIDVRLADDGTPMVLEMNPNPGISINNTLPKAALSLGLSYNDIIHEILIAALDRYNWQHSLKSRLESYKLVAKN